MHAKIIGNLMIAAILLSMIPAAYSQASVAEQRTQMEIKTMTTNLGAQIRLMQLEKAIQIRAEVGEKIIDRVQEKGADSSEMEAIVAELKLIAQEAKNVDPLSEDAIQKFVDLKSDAMELTHKFREKANEELDEEEKSEMREQARAIKQQRTEQANQIREKVRAYNKEKVEELQDNLGIQVKEIAQKIGTGELTTEEATQQIRQLVDEMVQEKKQNCFNNAKENSLRESIEARQNLDEIKEGFSARQNERLQNRLENIQGINGMLEERVRERIENQIENQQRIPGGMF